MLKFKRMFMLYAPNEEGKDGGGGSGYEDTTPDDKNDEGSEDAGDTDDYGYGEIPEEAGDEKSEDKADDKSEQTETSKQDEKKPVEKSSTGYLDEKGEPKSEEKPKEEEPPKKEEPPKTEEKPGEGEELLKDVKFEGVNDEDKKTLSDFIKTHKLPKEAAQAMVDLRKTESEKIKAFAAEHDKKMKDLEAEVKRGWIKELKEDKDFGGTNFAHSIKAAEKVMSEFFSNTKIKLTGADKMVPPYFMKDLAALHKKLYSKEKFDSNGNNPTPDSDDNNPDAHLDFYQ